MKVDATNTHDEARDAHTCLHALAAVALHYGVKAPVERLIHDHVLTEEPSPAQLVQLAREAGLEARHARLTFRQLKRRKSGFPLLAVLANGNGVAIAGITEAGEAVVFDPLIASGTPLLLDQTAMEAAWRGDVILLNRAGAKEKSFGLGWFMQQVVRQHGILRDVILAALFLNVLALATPIFFQIVVDKVLVHRVTSTLQVLLVGVLVAVVFESLLSFLRGYLLVHATRKIDAGINVKTFRHLLGLRASFFERATAGVLTKHMQQTARIREFLTGSALATLLDLTVLVVLLPVLVFYSPLLTAIVLGAALVLAGIIGALLVPLRQRLNALYQAEAERQSLLVETIHGMPTVKALALEPRQLKTWDETASAAVERTFSVQRLALVARTLSSLVEKLMLIAIIGVGVFQVFDGKLTVGALIAFQMLAGRVSDPLIRLVSLVHEYQETSLSVRMLGSVMNAPLERESDERALTPRIRGAIDIENLWFTYSGAPDAALKGVSLSLPPGSTLGIVGLSGSGKTTLSKLLQGLYPPQSGSIRIDGVDLREIDLAHLRGQMGVVLQEAFLFRGTVRSNIGRARPDASFEDIVEAAQLAGAHDFIQHLPQGYDTFIEESAQNLSGGQRQRIAIARALLRNPRILILDEATSALDPESEAAVQHSLERVRDERTVIIISHRLSMVRDADQIAVVEAGRIADIAPHDELMARSQLYRSLWTRQMGSPSPRASRGGQGA